MKFYPAGFLVVRAKHPQRYATFYRGVDRYPYQLPYPIPEGTPDKGVDLAEVAWAYQGAYLSLSDTEHRGNYCIYRLEECE